MAIQGIQAGLNFGGGLSRLSQSGVSLPIRSPASNALFARADSVDFSARLETQAARLTQLKESIGLSLDALGSAKKDLAELRRLTAELRTTAASALGGTSLARGDAADAFNKLRDAVDSFVQNNGSGLVSLLTNRPEAFALGSGSAEGGGPTGPGNQGGDFADRILQRIGDTLADRNVPANIADRVVNNLEGVFNRIFIDRARTGGGGDRQAAPGSGTPTETSVSAGLGFVRAPNGFVTDSDVEVALSAIDQALGQFNAIDRAIGAASSVLTLPLDEMTALTDRFSAGADRLTRARESDSDIGFALLNTRAGLSGGSQGLAPSSEREILGLFGVQLGGVGPSTILA